MGRHTRHAAAITAALAVVGAVAWLGVGSDTEPAVQAGSGTVAAAGKDRVTQPLRDEHKELIPHIDGLAAAGDSVGVASLAEQKEKVHASYVFLTEGLIPHAVAEDKVLYAKVDELVGTNGKTHATDTMRRDHQEVGTLTDELGKLGGKLEKGNLAAPDQHELRRVLYSLNGIVGLHFAKEEEVYLPLLDRTLTAEQAQEMFEEMEEVTAKETGGSGHAH
ncbi:MAG TPA: hemerythrin domain-containing protein [Intrasporangium sp.]|nr:hemerythrin domain-containing protein [Intrasporangium sp.]